MKLCATLSSEYRFAGSFGRAPAVAGVAGTEWDGGILADTHSDPDSAWTDEANAYDGDDATNAVDSGIPGHYLELHLTTPRLCRAVLAYINASAATKAVEIDIHWYGGAWENIYADLMARNEWTEIVFAEGTVDKVRIKSGSVDYLLLHELQFAPIIELAGDVSAEPRFAGSVAVKGCS